MSGSLNKVILIGNLGKDPEIKVTQGGKTLCRFSVATSESWKDAQGTRQTKTEWHNVVVWGKLAETADKYLRKGQPVCVEGRIQYDEYTDTTGAKRTSTSINCDNFVMLGGKPEGAERQATAPAQTSKLPDTYDDDIPF